LRTYLNRLQRRAPRRGRGAATGQFIDHVVKVSNRYWPGLFHTYEDPRIPRTTSQLERSFGASKQATRRTTGRKSTAGGKLESCGEAIVRVKALMAVLGPDELKQRVEAIPSDGYRAAKRQLHQMQQPARERRSIQRDPEAYLERVLDKWLDSS
jgi:hypothetical protein